MNKLVSIIIPVYNARDSLRKCVESVVYGNYRNVEILLVDDCSSDGSWELCCQLCEEFSAVKCFRNDKNSGPSQTRNRGLTEASGEYICFLDSDDWVSGQYFTELVNEAEMHPHELVICGFCFVNDVDNLKQDYLYETSAKTISSVEIKDSFSVLQKVMLQNVWNKIFCADVIRKHSLRFDVNKRMGEDFDFVLDYIEKKKCNGYCIINLPLYYYVRANNQSLMSQFGLTRFAEEEERYARVFSLCGSDACQKIYDINLNVLKHNYIYHIMHARHLKKQEKLVRIEELMQDGQAGMYYRHHMVVLAKEWVVQLKRKCIALPGRVAGKLNHMIGQYKSLKARKMVINKPLTIISQNCIGGVIYHDLGWKFLSPTINLFMNSADFVKFVNRLEHYISQEMVMRWDEFYPIGMLDDIEVHFMHYNTCRDAKVAWERRCSRMEWERILVLCTDRDGFTETSFEQWQQIEYPKLLFTANKKYCNHPDSLFFPEYKKQEMVGDLILRRKFYRHNALVRRLINTDLEQKHSSI